MTDTEQKVIAITFDDGPNTGVTNEILDLAEKYDVRFSFFVVGQNINPESAKVMKRAHDMGCEINCHSFTHSYMDKMSADEIKDETDRTARLIYEAVGEYPKFFRPPYIAVSRTMYETIDLPFISGIGCDDWNPEITAAQRVSVITQNCGDGCIVLLHDSDGNSRTVEALKEIVPFFIDAGYKLVTVSELFAAKGIVPCSTEEILYSYAAKYGWKE